MIRRATIALVLCVLYGCNQMFEYPTWGNTRLGIYFESIASKTACRPTEVKDINLPEPRNTWTVTPRILSHVPSERELVGQLGEPRRMERLGGDRPWAGETEDPTLVWKGENVTLTAYVIHGKVWSLSIADADGQESITPGCGDWSKSSTQRHYSVQIHTHVELQP